MSEADISYAKVGHCGVITLDRPRALNALTLPMVTAMGQALDAFAHDPAICSVVVKSAAANAFCAGADIKRLYELGKAGRHDEQLAFLRTEYQNCHRIKAYPKPYICLIDGIVMGGGAGIAINGAHRVVGDHVTFAMPEVGIGFFPDVGATYFLSRLPAGTGIYLALSGGRIGTADAVALGLATAHVPSGRFDALVERFAAGEAAADAIAAEAAGAPDSELRQHKDFIARAFCAPSLSAVFAEVATAARSGVPFAQESMKTLQSRSPTSLAIALTQMQCGAEMSFDDALRVEFRIASKIVYGHDFYEGVRAMLVDRDHAPHWRPATIEDVDAASIDAHFAAIGANELEFEAASAA